MLRLSFRQSMLAGFLLIALLLSWAAVRSWLVLEQFVERSRQDGERALQLSASIQELADRRVDLERNARQFLVLDDATLLERFDANVAHALATVGRLESIAGQALGRLPGDWRQAVDELGQGLHQAASGGALFPLLNRLAEVNSALGHAGQHWIDEQNAGLLAELDKSRQQLAGLVAAAVGGAFLVALAMSWWLARPIGTLERAIEQLGESRFATPVAVDGPADLQRVGRRLDWLRQRLGELEAERSRTLRHVSHELKTPLTALREGIALLQEQVPGPLDGAQQEVVDILQHNVMSLQRQLESLLRLNAASFEARRLSFRPLALRRLLANVVQGRELQIQARQLTVLRRAPAITRALDGEKLSVAVDNLLSNAIDFSPEGGVIRLEVSATGKMLRISCIDQGPGIAADDAERIFEPFVQGRRAAPAPRQGSGVGLSIVRDLMTSMGGRVALVPGDGKAKGAHFRLELPCEA
ncbi:ATP-binding protein [Accumulibacter sp.]|uniref:sensor histidine kinase n=1 Tax=Accumulibacter sp. TaxID=2053492 RepID=UPI0026055050|nr:ATP-binding protein [Accumulibacter sp.]